MHTVSVPSTVLILSTGRTGTRFLAYLMGTLSRTVESHHITPYSRLFNLLGNMRLSGWFPTGGIVWLWKVLKRRELVNCRAPILLDSNPHLASLADLVPYLYPDLKLVHVVRDPRDYVRSHLNWARQRPKSFFANYFLPFWQPNAVLLREMAFKQWFAMTKFEQFCWVWQFKNRHIMSLANADVPYHLVRFEDLFGRDEPEADLNRLLRFVGLPEVIRMPQEFQTPLNVTKNRSFPEWRGWSEGRCASLDELCGPMMTHFGYGNEIEWLEKVRSGQGLVTCQ